MTRLNILAVLTALGLAYLLVSLVYFTSFPLYRSLDFLLTTGQITRALDAYTAADIARHLHMIQVWDTAFPAYYGVVVAALVWRYWAGWRRAAMLALTLVAVVADYVENHYTVALLNGQGGHLPHVIATWIKFTAIAPPMNIGILRLWQELRRPARPAEG